jgi:hypothetical protein
MKLAPPDLAVPFDRITWRDGQPLTSRDMRDDKRSEDRLRWLHVHYLHGVWGIVRGLEVAFRGPQAIDVTSGFALDLYGRELLLPQAVTMRLPDVQHAFVVLTICYRPDCAYPAQLDLRGLCEGIHIAPRDEHAELLWKTVDTIELGCDVPLAAAWVDKGKLASALFYEVRHRARSEARPRLYAGETERGQTGWSVAQVSETPIAWLRAVVDTSEGGFAFTPCYFAQPSGVDESLFPSGPPLLFIDETRADGFTARILIGSDFPLVTTIDAGQAEKVGLTVAWFAVELPPSWGFRIEKVRS